MTAEAAASLTQVYHPMIEHDGERARRELAELVAAEPASVEANWLLAIAWLRCLDFARSAEISRRVLELDPEHSDALHNLAQCLLVMDDYEGAVGAYDQTFKATRSARSAARLAMLFHRLGRLNDAQHWNDVLLTRGQAESPEALWAARNMMSVLRDAGRPLASDRFAHAVLQRFRREPTKISSQLVDLDQSTAFHEWFGLAEKAGLSALLKRGLQAEPGARVPETFELPQGRDALARFAAAAPPGTLYIAKPARGTGGQGIFVTDQPSRLLARTDVVVQRYVDRPYLVDGRKGHLRIYCLITSMSPLRAYVYSEGIVRFAPEPYDPSPERLADVSMHVTNTALHRGHPGLVISEDPNKEDEGAVWSLSAYLKRIEADGGDRQAVFGEIRDLVGWFVRLLRREGLIERQARRGSPRAFASKLLGFDVLLDADGHPWLLEIQAKPASVGQPLVARINGELYNNIFRMTVGCVAQDAMTAAQLEAVRTPDGLMAREAEIERANIGRFVALDL
jgi:hypothetical protein